ncbi:unnamed protein product [Urochloa humidicola]
MGVRPATRCQGGRPPLEAVRKQPSRAAAGGQTGRPPYSAHTASGEVMAVWANGTQLMCWDDRRGSFFPP